MARAKCYLCGDRYPRDEMEVSRYTVPSAARGGTVQGVTRYVRMCLIGHGCKAAVSGNDLPATAATPESAPVGPDA